MISSGPAPANVMSRHPSGRPGLSEPGIEINPGRLIADMRALAAFGKLGSGVSRVAFSEPDIAARHWLRRRMEEAGLEAVIDNAANVIGRMRSDRPGVLIGSHSDSVPQGGWLDGAMGVIYGLEIARAVIEADAAERFPVDAVSFQDEETTYLATFGSRSLFGEVQPGEIEAARNIDGRPLAEAIGAAGVAGNPEVRLDPARYAAYLEAHIEQGPRLEAAGLRIGIVTAIVGIRRYRIEIAGEAGHAGTVPMDMRKDAGAAAITLANAILEEFRSLAGPDSVWNIGTMTLTPGAANVVPSKAEFVVELRDTDEAAIDLLGSRLEALVRDRAGRNGLPVEVTRPLDIAPSRMDPALGTRIEEAAKARGAPYMYMPSGAGHDAMIASRHMPSAMLFVPSIGGRSHTLVEDTDEADIILGCQVLADAVTRILA